MAKQALPTKTKKREWINVQGPKLFNMRNVGETLVLEPKQAVGRTIVTNLMVLTNDPKKQHVNITLQIDGLKGNEATTRIIGYEVIPASLKRNVRRNRERVDISFPASTRDSKTIRVKAMMITATLAPNSVQTALRMHTQGWITKYVNENDYDSFVNDIISGRMQRILKGNLKTIFPLKSCDIRMMTLVSDDPAMVVKPTLNVTREFNLDPQPPKRREPRQEKEVEAYT